MCVGGGDKFLFSGQGSGQPARRERKYGGASAATNGGAKRGAGIRFFGEAKTPIDPRPCNQLITSFEQTRLRRPFGLDASF